MRLIDADALIETMRENAEGNEGWYGDTWAFMRDVENAPTIDVIPHWIPCEERLPEYFDYVLLSSSKYGLKIGARTRKSNFNSWYFNEPLDCDVWHVTLSDNWYNFEDFTAWMPLPEPYKGERRDDE